MNKTVTINISGIIFHIAEDAYEKLSRYLATIKGYFSDSDGRDEIMADIEARIAEMLQGKVSPGKQVVLMSDVDEVIAIMGKPEEFRTDSDSSAASAEPEAKEEHKRTGRRRVFRDTDDRVLGGVCSGIAAYFNIDPLWLRIAFAISFFMFGTGLLFYILLWIIIPEAKTTAEKLEMRGERVDVNNISRTVSEEMENVKKRVHTFGKEMGSKENRERMRTGIDRLIDFIASFFLIIGKIIAVLFIAAGTILLVVMLSTMFGINDINIHHRGEHISFSLYEGMNSFFTSSQADLALTGLILLVGIPLIALIYLGIRLLFKVKEGSRIVKFTLLSLWIAGWVLVCIAGVQVSKDFDEKNTSRETYTLRQATGSTLYVRLRKDENEELTEAYDSRVMIDDWNIVKVDGKNIVFGYPMIDIIESETDSFEIVIEHSAYGATKKESLARSKSIRYEFAQHDSILEFDPYFRIDTDDKFRDQEVKVVLKVPKGKTIHLGKSMEQVIYDIHNVRGTWDSEMVNRRWVMTPSGLDCVDCEGLEDRRHHHEHNEHHDAPVPPAPPAPPVINNVGKKNN